MLTKIKEKTREWVCEIAELTHDVGLTPNILTFIGLILAVVSAFLYIYWRRSPIFIPLAATIFLFSGFCDVLDGTMATMYSRTTIFGGFLDSVLDRYSDALVICAIIVGDLCDPMWGLAALVGSFLVSYVRARAEAFGIEMAAVGLAERAERILIITVASFLNILYEGSIGLGIIFLAVLAHLTVLQRVYHMGRTASSKRSS